MPRLSRDAGLVYERALLEQRQEKIARTLDKMAAEHRQLQDADRLADADELAIKMEKLHAELVERDYHREQDAARMAIAGHKVRAELAELEMLLESADEADREELEHTIQILTQKLRELELRERHGREF